MLTRHWISGGKRRQDLQHLLFILQAIQVLTSVTLGMM
jgi:hypothetical protein